MNFLKATDHRFPTERLYIMSRPASILSFPDVHDFVAVINPVEGVDHEALQSAVEENARRFTIQYPEGEKDAVLFFFDEADRPLVYELSEDEEADITASVTIEDTPRDNQFFLGMMHEWNLIADIEYSSACGRDSIAIGVSQALDNVERL